MKILKYSPLYQVDENRDKTSPEKVKKRINEAYVAVIFITSFFFVYNRFK